jgi:general secretion pathway protein H
VLAILGLLTAVALPRLSGSEANAELQSSAREIAAALRSTRSLAMSSGRAESFLLDTGAGVFRAPTAPPVALPRGIRPVLITAVQEQRDAATGGIRFFPDGSSTGGGVRLIRGYKQSEVLVDWLTGRVSVATR